MQGAGRAHHSGGGVGCEVKMGKSESGGTSAGIRSLWEEALKGCSPTVHLFITELMAFKDGGAGTEPTAVFPDHPPPPSELWLTRHPAE